MNQNQIQQLTSHLSQALDQNYDVVNMETVLSVICALEGTTITKEQLEATRLAKYINQLRRRTTNEHLARRAKSLLKKWREMVGMQQTINDSQQQQHQQQQAAPKLAIGMNTTEQSIAETVVNTNTIQYSRPSSPMLLEQQQNAGADHVPFGSLKPAAAAAANANVNAWNVTKSANLNTQNRIINTDSHSNMYASETSCTTNATTTTTAAQQPQQQHTNFSNLIVNINNRNSEENSSGADKLNKFQRKQQKHVEPFINEHSSNSVSNFAVANDKLHETSIVIDIASDSDDYDASNQDKVKTTFPASTTSSSTLALPPAAYPKPKKLKKDKKRKEKDSSRSKSALLNPTELPAALQQTKFVQAKDTNVIPAFKDATKVPAATNYPAVSEILSLSNSSMSSILSGDTTTTGNSLPKVRNSSSDLSFAGRFKSINQLDASNNEPVPVNLVNGQKTLSRAQDAINVDQQQQQQSQPQQQQLRNAFYAEFITNDTSTSGSRLSPFEEIDSKLQRNQAKLMEDVGAALKQQQQIQGSTNLGTPKSFDAHKSDYAENAHVQVPKKRGRKKGSKGVDSVIAKESSLSQQIFFGSGVKKVKTTKELFNEIQNRKLSIAANRSETLASATKEHATTPTYRAQQAQRSLHSRPPSSCSETSTHSMHTMDDNSANVTMIGEDKLSNRTEDTGNTDSDTATSTPSHDSVKSRNIKRSTSLDSTSNSEPTSSAKTTSASTPASADDVSTQLMHLVHSLSSPLSIEEAEAAYQAQIVPCTCVVLVEMPEPNVPDEPSTNQSEASVETIAEISSLPETNSLKSCDEPVRMELLGEPMKSESDSDGGVAAAVEELQVLLPPRALATATPPPPPPALPPPPAPTPAVVKPPRPIKSIFDLDFDDDEDPLQAIIQDVSPSIGSLSSESKVEQSDTSPTSSLSTVVMPPLDYQQTVFEVQRLSDSDTEREVVEPPPPPPPPPPEPLPIYTVQEDPDCAAKERFHVQTNQVNDFHINSLHNYFIPNINGNWNGVEMDTTLPLDKNDLNDCKVYSVSDGADVVPKYGSLECESIRKDLSGMALSTTGKYKLLRSHMTPFLGVAKCLPSCRRNRKLQLAAIAAATAAAEAAAEAEAAAAALKATSNIKVEECSNMTTLENSLEMLPESNNNNNSDMNSALIVDVELEEQTQQPPLEQHDDLDMPYANESHYECTAKNNNTHFGYNLLKLATDNDDNLLMNTSGWSLTAVDDEEQQHQQEQQQRQQQQQQQHGSNSRRSSSCSNSSLKKTQHSINEKLRNQRSLQQQQEKHGRKRKKRRKAAKSKLDSSCELECARRPRIKRIKIAINGNVATQRQISNVSSSNNSSSDSSSDNSSNSSNSSNNNSNDDEEEEEEEDSATDAADVRAKGAKQQRQQQSTAASDDELESMRSHSTTVDSLAADEEQLLEHDYDNNSNDEEQYAIVQRHMGGGNNHIVLTIKKTPSKIHSPANSLSAVSPAVATNAAAAAAAATIATTTMPQVEMADAEAQAAATVDLHAIAVDGEVHPEQQQQQHQEKQQQEIAALLSNQTTCLNAMDCCRLLLQRRRRRHYRRRRRRQAAQPVDIELKHLFNTNDAANAECPKTLRLHQKLFFHDELSTHDNAGRKQRIFNYSSSSSSSSSNGCNDSDCEEKDEKEEKEDDGIDGAAGNAGKLKFETDTTNNSTKCEAAATWQPAYLLSNDTSNNDEFVSATATATVTATDTDIADANAVDDDMAANDNANVNDTNATDIKTELNYHRTELPMFNNGMLPSFNSIYANEPEQQTTNSMASSQSEVKGITPTLNQNCDDVNLYYNNNNNNLSEIKHSLISNDNNVSSIHSKNVTSNISNVISDQSLNEMLPRLEYRTGIRPVVKDGPEAATSDNCSGTNIDSRMQQFKEWHQVLHLQSYNKEPLIVLPYVVLE